MNPYRYFQTHQRPRTREASDHESMKAKAKINFASLSCCTQIACHRIRNLINKERPGQSPEDQSPERQDRIGELEILDKVGWGDTLSTKIERHQATDRNFDSTIKEQYETRRWRI